MFSLNISQADKLIDAMKNFQGNSDEVISNVLHNEGGMQIQESIRRLIPVSGKTWAGKKGPAKTSNSLKNVNSPLTVTVKSNKSYQYLYFPDDGTNTRRHVGNQQFFARGADLVADDIVDQCVSKLINNFEKGV